MHRWLSWLTGEHQVIEPEPHGGADEEYAKELREMPPASEDLDALAANVELHEALNVIERDFAKAAEQVIAQALAQLDLDGRDALSVAGLGSEA